MSSMTVAAAQPLVIPPDPRPDPSVKEYGQQASEVRVLVDRFRAGDQDAFARLYRLYQPQVSRFALSRVRDVHLAEDLTAEVFTKAAQALRRLQVRGDDLSAWFTVVTKNVIADHFRTADTRPVMTLSPRAGLGVVDVVNAEAAPEATLVRRRDVVAAVRSLPERQRAVVVHRLLLDLSVAETARRMDCHPMKVKHALRAALPALAALLSPEVAPA